ncbi:TIGR00366 family protein [Mameliella alba]|uniref:TIGR00366 family protein n=1 Tax=Mameliella alba TaxID=561184 RepID=UPI00143186E9|nr:TIGR00366 family protein [Mameliella alba]
MIKGITRASVNMVERYLPDAFVLVLVLTLVVFGAGMLVEGHGPVAMAVAWGDTWTNLVQPFWALPALAIAGLSAKDIMGYCLIVLVATGVVLGLGLTFLP